MKTKHAGLSLIELMIAMTIGLVLLGGVIQIFANNKQAFRLQEAMSRTQETGRFAITWLAKEIRMADYWGCASSISKITNNLDPTGVGYASLTFANGISGADGATDTLTIGSAGGTGITIESPFGPQESANIKVPADSGLLQGDVVLVSDCQAGDIFQISNANPESGTVVHNTGSATEPGNSNPGACSGGGSSHCLSKVYEGDAQLFRLNSVSFTVANNSDGIPGLFRAVNTGAAQELITGVENLQIMYGEDTDSDGVVNIYRTATNVTDWETVLAVRVSIVVRSDEEVLPSAASYVLEGATITPGDRRFRRVFTDTVTIRNRTS